MHALSHLQALEAEAIGILREVAASFSKPCMFYSIGKDSTVMLHLARKAFWPGPVPFTLLHIDTTWEFAEMARFRDELVARWGLKLLVHVNREALAQGVHPIESGSVRYNDQMKTQALKQAMAQHRFDAALGGARRDEEKSRAKERVFSVRDAYQNWDPKNQRPELWGIYNTQLNPGESLRVFPLSNWTELDIWLYILREGIDLVSLYFAQPRTTWRSDESGQVFILDDERMLPYLSPRERASIALRQVRCRTLGCYPQTGAVLSQAQDVAGIIQELLLSKTSEREGRMLDKDQVGSMEKKKREGYF
ncbi:MAG TPA: sulfate adenylyltransferase subunit CysD [Cellvibrionaceae bacterium]|nr:sulfate adenylyltransferase subunit CysD [Cellvibrionaceae bacterium]HMW71401.1 sulfate adenylyltransferase subunit CysD [Cellvibrionaceae bacterium]HNG61110.1 sulfate adenylyltransferase subunit CysD [Cellvibrionaceae bacterium]